MLTGDRVNKSTAGEATKNKVKNVHQLLVCPLLCFLLLLLSVSLLTPEEGSCCCCLSLFLHLKKAVAVDVCLSSYTWRRLLLLNALVYYCIPCVLSHWWVSFPTSVLMLKLNPEIWVPDLRLDTKPQYLLWLKSLDKLKTLQHSPPKKNKLWKTGSNTTAAEQKSEKKRKKLQVIIQLYCLHLGCS